MAVKDKKKFDLSKSYWGNKGKHQALYDALSKKLIPSQGAAQTAHGELLRSFANLYHDRYNNGLCNASTFKIIHAFTTIVHNWDEDIKGYLKNDEVWRRWTSATWRHIRRLSDPEYDGGSYVGVGYPDEEFEQVADAIIKVVADRDARHWPTYRLDVVLVEHGYQANSYVNGDEADVQCRDFGDNHEMRTLLMDLHEQVLKAIESFRKDK